MERLERTPFYEVCICLMLLVNCCILSPELLSKRRLLEWIAKLTHNSSFIALLNTIRKPDTKITATKSTGLATTLYVTGLKDGLNSKPEVDS